MRSVDPWDDPFAQEEQAVARKHVDALRTRAKEQKKALSKQKHDIKSMKKQLHTYEVRLHSTRIPMSRG